LPDANPFRFWEMPPMIVFARSRFTVYISVAAALLAGCGGSQPPIGATGAITETFAPAAHAFAGTSSIHPPRYIYVTNLARSDSGAAPSVTVYPAGRSGNVPPSEVITGSQTQLSEPDGIVVNDSGEIYVADSGTDEIVGFQRGAKGNATPNVVIAGSNTLLQAPVGLSLDAKENLYVGNCGSACRTSFAPPSVLEFKAGSNGNVAPIRDITGAQTELADANDPAIGPAGDIYVSNTTTYTIDVFRHDANGNVKPVRVIAGSRTQLDQPDGIAISSRWLYASASRGDYLERFHRKANADAPPAAIIRGDKTRMGNVDGISLDDLGVLYAASPSTSSIVEFAPLAHGNVRPFRKIGGSRTQLNYPLWVFVR
jgi:sugar lactone lactonase YvrE